MYRTEEENKSIKLILRIINNIIQNPNNNKYKDISILRILNKLNNRNKYINLLLKFGFDKSNDGKRLIFNLNKLNKLKQLHQLLTHKSHNNHIYPNNDITKNVM